MPAKKKEPEAEQALPPLNFRQARYVEEFIVDYNQTAAAVRVGYSPRSAASIASQLMRRPEIQAAIRQAVEAKARRLELDGDQVLREIMAIAFGAASDETGSPLKYASKLKALEIAGKYYGVFEEAATVRLTGRVTVSDLSSLSDEELRRIASGDGDEG